VCQANDVIILDLSSTALTGTIPRSLPSVFPALQYLYLDNNPALGGTIPSSFSTLTSLRTFYSRGSNLTSGLDVLATMPNLQYIDVGDNQIGGSFPSSIFQQSLMYLYLNDNHLTGSLTGWPAYLPNLRSLWLHNNQLTGDLPDVVGNWGALTELRLYNSGLNLPLSQAMTAQLQSHFHYVLILQTAPVGRRRLLDINNDMELVFVTEAPVSRDGQYCMARPNSDTNDCAAIRAVAQTDRSDLCLYLCTNGLCPNECMLLAPFLRLLFPFLPLSVWSKMCVI